jgi:D-lyxose ketol-isomerase
VYTRPYREVSYHIGGYLATKFYKKLEDSPFLALYGAGLFSKPVSLIIWAAQEGDGVTLNGGGTDMTREVYLEARARALAYLEKAGIALTDAERAGLEVADFGLGDLERTGLELVTYVNTQRCCAKELVLFPGQTCPEHRHPDTAFGPGKEETFRCRWGEVYVYVAGTPTERPAARPPMGNEAYYTAAREVTLRPGEQYTLAPDTAHWFQGGPEGAVVSEFSTTSRDELDVFTDPRIQRTPVVE